MLGSASSKPVLRRPNFKSMSTQESIVKRTETAINDAASLWRRRRILCILVLTVIVLPTGLALIGIPNLRHELKSRTQERDKLEIQLAPFLAAANRSFPDIPAEERLGALKEGLDSLDRSVGVLGQQIELILDRSSIIPTLYDLLQDGQEPSHPDELTLRRAALVEYKEKNYTAALLTVSRALEVEGHSVKANLLLAYIYSDLYREFAPRSARGQFEKSQADTANNWYLEGVESCRKTATLAETANSGLQLDALLQLSRLHAEKGVRSERDESDRLFEKALRGIYDLETAFPSNKQVAASRSLVEELKSIKADFFDWEAEDEEENY